MYSVIGLLTKPSGMDQQEFRQWWLEEHARRVLGYAGLREYVAWPVDEVLNQDGLQFSDNTPYAGIAVITFDTKQDFLAAVGSATGSEVNSSFNRGAPTSTVLCGQQYVFMRDGKKLDPAPSSAS